MKWARVKPGEPDINPYIQQGDAGCYKDYEKEEHIRKTFVHPSHQWVKHEFYFPSSSAKRYLRFQKRYEIFCGGYLYFYDEKVRSGTIDHVLYFQWDDFVPNGYNTVSIYLTPPPAKKKRKAKMAAEKTLAYKMNVPELVTADNLEKKGNGSADTSVHVLQQVKSATAMADETTSDMAIDPPPPPPPPPPSMQDH